MVVLVDDSSSEPQPELGPEQQQKLLKRILLRVLSAAILAAIALSTTYLGGWPFFGLVTAAGGIALVEWMRITDHSETLVLVLSLVAMIASAVAAMFGQTAYALAVVCLFAGILWCYSSFRGTQGRWVAIGFLYVTGPVVSLVYLMEVQGRALIFWIFGIVWAMDIGAYICGSVIGGPKLAPRLSPNKTWSGLVGGALCAAFVAVVLGELFSLGSSFHLSLAGAFLAAWSQIGDLLESGFKRRFHVKDSGRVIPGHGGVLDRIDSLLFTAPLVAFLFWSFCSL